MHECGNWDRDSDISFLGIFVSKILYFVFVVFFTRVAHIEIVGGVEGPEVKPGLDVGLPTLILHLAKDLLV
jgi:hypothetical protein